MKHDYTTNIHPPGTLSRILGYVVHRQMDANTLGYVGEAKGKAASRLDPQSETVLSAVRSSER
jgi:hypothetical protein